MRNGRTRVVVTGMGTVNPLGKDLEEYWHGLIEGRSGASPIERFPSDRLPTKFACQVNTFNAQDYIERKTASRMARFSQMAVAASGMALADSGIDLSKEDDFRVGVAMGTGIGAFDDMRKVPPRSSPRAVSIRSTRPPSSRTWPVPRSPCSSTFAVRTPRSRQP